MSSYDSQANRIKMANQISGFFRTQTPEDEAASAQSVAGHIKLFWAPCMRAALVEQIDRGAFDGVDPIVVTAVRNHRATLVNGHVHVAAEETLLGPERGGDAG